MIHDIEVAVEDRFDPVETAELASAVFGRGSGYSRHYLEWLYGRAFGGDTSIVAIRAGGRKIGQGVILWQPFLLDGQRTHAAQIVDLFIAPRYRSHVTARMISNEISNQIHRRAGPVMSVPNARVRSLKQRFLQLEPALRMRMRAGMALPGGNSIVSCWHLPETAPQIREMAHAALADPGANGIDWSSDLMLWRLDRPQRRFVVHRSDNLCAITSFRFIRRIPVVLVCGLFAINGRRVEKRETAEVLRRAAREHEWPFWLYIGHNRHVRLPGREISGGLRLPSVEVVANANFPAARIDRFETLDFNFA